MRQRLRMWLVLAAVFAIVAAACGSGDDDTGATDAAEEATTTAAAAEETTTTAAGDTTETTEAAAAPTGDTIDRLKVGVLLPLTGFVAGPGEDSAQGLQLFFDQNGANGGTEIEVDGITVEYILEDTGSDPAVALTSATKLVDVDNVDIIIPGILASTGGAVGDALGDRTDVLLLSPYSCNDDFTQRAPLQGYARPGGWACSQTSHAFGKWAAEEAGYQRIATACADYTFGYEHCGGFADAFTASGGEIVNQIWFPPPTQDFGTYSTQLAGLDVDAVMALSVGGSAIPFMTAYSDFGLKQSVPLLAGAVTTDQSVLRAMDREVAIGTISHGHWAEGADIPETQQFVEEFEAATGKIASYYAAANFAAMQWIVATLRETGGQFEPQLWLDTMTGGMEISTPFGPQTLDEFGSPILNVYVREVVERDDGKLWNVPIFTYEGVDQFFPFDQATYLQQPAYTKEFQGNGVGG